MKHKNSTITWIGTAAVAVATLALGSRSATSQSIQTTTPVLLQPSTPGTAQIGHINVSGTAKAAYLKGNGLGVTGINAMNIAVGTLNDARLSPNVPRLDANNSYTGLNLFSSPVGIGSLSPSAGLDVQSQVNGLNMNVANTLYVNGTMSYAGIGRSTPVGGESFGVKGKSTLYNSMVLEGPELSKVGLRYVTGYANRNAELAYVPSEWRFVTRMDNMDLMSLDSGGELTIGKQGSDPGIYMPNSGHMVIQAPGGYTKLWLGVVDNYMDLELVGGNNHRTFEAATIANYPNNGFAGVADLNGAFQAKMYVDSNGNGVVTGDVKNFVVPNPRNNAEDIVYASLEGPEAAAYVRGTGRLVNGRAWVSLPEHFQDVAVLQGMTVQLTAGSFDSKGLATGQRSLAGFEVGELNGGRGNYAFDWEVKCVRKGHEDYKPVRAWDESLPAGNRQEMWAGRLASIRARQARTGGLVPRP